ncbi:MAG: hypothetical protein AB3N63_08210 [Puniceicoccaceae bacterium]
MKRSGIRWFLVSLLLTAGSLNVSGFSLAPWIGPNIRLGDDPAALPDGNGQNQAEPHAIRSITDPDLILATFQEGRFPDGGAYGNGYAVSEDGGLTWRRALNPRLTLVEGGPYHRGTDPVAGIDRNENLYLNSLVAMDPQFDQGRLVIQRSQDRGMTWTDPITIYTGTEARPTGSIFPDKNWMVVDDYSDSPHPGRVVVTWTNFRSVMQGQQTLQDYLILASHSDDLGQSWSFPVDVTPSPGITIEQLAYQGSRPVFLPGGGLAVVYHNFITSALEVQYSPDGGVSFPYDGLPVHISYLLYDTPNMRDGSFLPSVEVARETGDIFIAYMAKPTNIHQYAKIYFVRSNLANPGTSPAGQPDWNFSAPRSVSGSTPNWIVSTPTITVSSDGQRISIYYYDNRNGTGINDSGDFYCVQSVDGGTNWTSPVRLTEQVFPLSAATWTNRGYMIGDYFGFAPPLAADQAGVAVWVDTRDGTADPWSARVADTSLPVSESWLQAQLPYALHSTLGDDWALEDPDNNGLPLGFEYLLGRSPYDGGGIPQVTDETTFRILNPATDPEIQVTVQGFKDRWPSETAAVTDLQPLVEPAGEGFWDEFTWPVGSGLRHLALAIENSDTLFLMEETSPSRWMVGAGEGWLWSNWFGMLHPQHAPWLFHNQLGWLYDLEGVFYSDALSAYLWADRLTFPWMYQDNGAWLYVSEEEPWVYDSGTESWLKTY